MFRFEKLELIKEIHEVALNHTEKRFLDVNKFNKLRGLSDFLVYLYPAIAAGQKCQLWGSCSEHIGTLLFLRYNFDTNHPIWDFIEFKEIELFVIEGMWMMTSGRKTSILDSCVVYNIAEKKCYVKKAQDTSGAEKTCVIFQLGPDYIFGNDFTMSFDNPEVEVINEK